MPEIFGAALMGGGSGPAFAAIGAIYPAGAICTCSYNGQTLTAKDTSGRALFLVPSAGQWLVKATSSTATEPATATVNVTEETTYTVTLSFGWYVYNEGNQYTDKTGGWSKIGDNDTVIIGPSTMTVQPAVYNNKTVLSTINKVDLTNINTLIFTVKNTYAWPTGCPRIGVAADNTIVQPQSGAMYVTSTGIMDAHDDFTDVPLDTSSVNGEYYIVIAAYWNDGGGGQIIEVKSIRGE